MIITAGIYKGRKITAPDKSIARPTLSKIRMGVFNTLYSILGGFEGKTFLDLFGGSGIMGLEAISRGFSRVKVFEKNPAAVRTIKNNYKMLGITPDLAVGNSEKLILKTDEVFDVVYIDPPYESGIYKKILPDLKGEILIAEHCAEQDFSEFEILVQKNYGGKFVTFFK